MNDPILLAHEREPLYFGLGGPFSPISIRDQMFRAQTIVDRAVAHRIISPDRPLLVVGAGAAGTTAAICATYRHQVPTLLVERERMAFHLQKTSDSRWLDPYLYDYPMSHWHESTHPLPDSSPVAFKWTAGFSSDVAQQWDLIFSKMHGPLPKTHSQGWHPLTFSFPDTVIQQTLIGGPTGYRDVVTARMYQSGIAARGFGMILDCVGFPSELRTVGTFTGRAFWDTDELLKPDLGIHPGRIIDKSKRPTIVISGAGDGALQDVLRAVTGAVSARQILGHLESQGILLPEQICRALSDAEDQANRAYSWSTPEHARDHQVLCKLQESFEKQVKLFVGTIGKSKLAGALMQLSRVRGPVPQVHLIHCCSHFSQSYGINRFLVLLLHEVIPDVFKWRKQSAVYQINSLGGLAHICNPAFPEECCKHPHEVRVQINPQCTPQSVAQDDGAPIRADLVIVRHGPNYKSVTHSHPRSRHLLPYYVPWNL